MRGTDIGIFSPEQELDGESLVNVLWKFAQRRGYDVGTDGAMAWAEDIGIIGLITPETIVTRQQLAESILLLVNSKL